MIYYNFSDFMEETKTIESKHQNSYGAIKVISVDLQEAKEWESSGIYYFLKDNINEDNKMYGLLLTGILILNDDTPYNNKKVELDIEIPLDYPYKPPIIKIKTPFYHPNVNLYTGDILIDILYIPRAWSPVLRIGRTLLSIMSVLNEPDLEGNIFGNVLAKDLYLEDRIGYIKKVREYEEKRYLDPL